MSRYAFWMRICDSRSDRRHNRPTGRRSSASCFWDRPSRCPRGGVPFIGIQTSTGQTPLAFGPVLPSQPPPIWLYEQSILLPTKPRPRRSLPPRPRFRFTLSIQAAYVDVLYNRMYMSRSQHARHRNPIVNEMSTGPTFSRLFRMQKVEEKRKESKKKDEPLMASQRRRPPPRCLQ